MLRLTEEEKNFPHEILIVSILVFFFQLCIFSFQVNLIEAADAADILISGEKAFAKKDYTAAEKFFDEAVKIEPKNYKALRSLAEVKIKLEKFQEAESFLDRILALPATTGRDILVYLPGDPEAQEAEIVDDNVMALDESPQGLETQKPKSKFLKNAPIEPVPHYRVYLKKTGKMKLLPKSKTRVVYKGLPTATREETKFLKTEVQKKVIAAAGGKSEEELAAIPAGCFQMGSRNGDPDERPVHEVCLSAFKIGKYEVGQMNFQSAMGFNPSRFVAANLPVDSVSWLDASAYCKKRGLRLPTEAEWEFAFRGGTATDYYWGSALEGKLANFCDSLCELNNRDPGSTDGFKNSAPMGSFPPNPYGLYDMAGNLSEWVQDWMDIDKNYYRVSPKQDPEGARSDLIACMGVRCSGASSVTQKIFRGGSWNQKGTAMRSANRSDAHYQLRLDGLGFRCAANADSGANN